MSGYENAPATLLIATHCAVCARPLVDALSVETGIGPDCRKKHGYTQPDIAVDVVAVVSALAASLPVEVYMELTAKASISTEARACANVLVHRIAAEQTGPLVAAYTAALSKLGFTKLADRIAKRIGKVEVHEDGAGFFVIRTPFNESFVSLVRGLPGRRFVRDENGKGGVNKVPAPSLPSERLATRKRIWSLLKTTFPAGTIVYGDRGMAVL